MYSNGHYRDFEYKKKIMEDGYMMQLERQVKRAIFLNETICGKDGTVIMTPETAKEINDLLCNNSDYIEARKINAGYRQRKKRLKDRITDIIYNGNDYFITLTFSDKYYGSLDDKIKRKYVTRYLKIISPMYVANEDYGGNTDRLHYHAVASLNDLQVPWEYGYSYFEKIRSSDDVDKLAKYISKLTNHAIKETARGSHLIYSRITKN